MPIFHATSITSWVSDQTYTHPNTPQGYNPPNDMISWEVSGTSLTLKEDVTAFAVVSAGSSVTFKGKIHCPTGAAGGHGLLVRAFDARYTNPYAVGEDPLSEHIMSFTVGSGTPPPNDRDSDGIPDNEDNCPDDYNPGQEDTDGDGIGDACEGQPGPPVVDITSTSWVTVAVLSLGTIGGAGIVISKGPKLLKV